MPDVAVQHVATGDVVVFHVPTLDGRTYDYTRTVTTSVPRSGAFNGSDRDFWFLGVDEYLPHAALHSGVYSAEEGRSDSILYLEVLRGVLLDVTMLATGRRPYRERVDA